MLPPPRLPDPLPPAADPVVVERGTPTSDLLSWTIKVCLVLGIVGFGATQYLSRHLDGLRPAALLREARLGQGPADPETTGSIGRQADRIVLDPCTASLGLR